MLWASVGNGGEVAVADSDLELAEAIDVLRAELRKAQDSGRASDVRFSVGPVEVELAIEVVKKAGGGVSVNVLNLLSVEGKRGVSKGETNRVKVALNPIGADGKPFEVSAARDQRPDPVETGVRSGG
jgi:Trypsin-co-occurring domain 2